MKEGMIAAALALGLMGLSGCGNAGDSICSKAAECAKKAGTAFSESQCKDDAKTTRELAASKNCGSQLDDWLNCLADLACGADATANCGGKQNTFTKCIQ